MNILVTADGTTPQLMHNPRMVDPEYEITREIKALTGKRKKTDDDLHKIEELEWYGGLYAEPDANGQLVVVVPTSKMRKCMINAAKISKLGKAVERAVSFAELHVPLIYEGPRDIKALFEDRRFHSRLSVVVGGRRIMRVRPKFFPWRIEVRGVFIEDAGLNWDELVRVVELAGVVEGIGDNRVNGYGRFVGKVQQI